MIQKKRQLNEISLSQFVMLIYKTQIGLSVLTLPRQLVEYVETEGIISLLIGYMITNLFSVFIIRTMEKHPGMTIFEVLKHYLGNGLGNLIILIWVFRTLFIASIVMLSTVQITKFWILPNTSSSLLFALFFVPIYMLTKQGIQIMGRFAQFVYGITFWMLGVLFLTLHHVDWLHFLPLIQTSWQSIFVAVSSTFTSFMGFELAFIFYPYLKQPKKAVKGILIANTLTLNILMSVVVICYLKFNIQELKMMIWPTLHLLKLVQLPFLERLEVFFLSFYLFVLFMTVAPYLYTAMNGMQSILKKRSTNKSLFVVFSCWFLIIFLLDPTIKELTDIEKVFNQFDLIFLGSFIFISWVFLGRWRKGLNSS